MKYMYMYVHFVGEKNLQRTMFLHRSKEDLEELGRIVKEDLRRETIAEHLAKGPYFKVMSHKKM